MHRCVHCGRIIEKASRELLEGCKECGSKFFFFIRDDSFLKNEEKEIENLINIDKKSIEEDVRNILGIEDEETPVVLDIESIRIIGKGKFEIDLVSLMNKKPLIIKVSEGKYVIDFNMGNNSF